MCQNVVIKRAARDLARPRALVVIMVVVYWAVHGAARVPAPSGAADPPLRDAGAGKGGCSVVTETASRKTNEK